MALNNCCPRTALFHAVRTYEYICTTHAVLKLSTNEETLGENEYFISATDNIRVVVFRKHTDHSHAYINRADLLPVKMAVFTGFSSTYHNCTRHDNTNIRA